MKFVTSLFATFIVAIVAGCASERNEPKSSEANISRTEAERTALAQVPNGAIKEGELERERGRLIWSFDIATPGSRDTTEVNVDAQSGKVIGVSKETPEREKSEKEDAK